MSTNGRHRDRPDPSAEAKRAQASQEHATATQTATEQAAHSGPDLSEFQSKEFIDTAFTPDVNRGDGVPGVDDNRIEERFSAEFSRHQGLGFIRRADWELERWLNKAKAILAKQEYARPNGLGSRCRPGVREAWTELTDPLGRLDDDLAREIAAAFDEKTMTESLSIDARGFRGLTEVTAVTRSEGYDRGGDGGGRSLASKLTFGLVGGR